MPSSTYKPKRGPEPERVKIDGDWREAVARALQKAAAHKPKKRKKK